MSLLDKIKEAGVSAVTYPDLVIKLIAIGIQSYTVDVATGITLYRTIEGEQAIKQDINQPRTIAEFFDKEMVIKAIRENQAGNSDYATFMQGIADAGVYFYEATLAGENKRVTYIGTGDNYEEKIPL